MSSPRLPLRFTDQNAPPISTDGGRPETMVDKTGAFVPADELLPRAFGRYELRRLLGKGGMGRVYLAYDPQLDRLVALKMPNPVENIAGWRDRFFVEARAAATLTHPHVCAVYEVGEVDGQPYLTMAFIEGETVAATLLKQGPLTPTAAVELVCIVARAMHEAHRRGIIHRDLKPANLILDGAGRPIIMDFGLAIRSTSADDLRLTLTGVALGTPAYMPPEQAGGDHDTIGPASDVYSLGVVLFELLTGRPPFRGKTFGKLLAQIERDPPPSPSAINPAVDAALEAIVLKALAKLPTDRFASAREFADALERYQQGDHAGVISRYSGAYRIPDATTEFQTSLITAAARTPKPRRTGRWVALAATLFAVVVACGAAIYVETDYGQIVVQLNDPNAKVDVRVNGQEVTLDPGGAKAVRVRAGANRKLEVTGPDFETVSESFDVKRGGVTVAHVTLVPKGAAAVAPAGTKFGDSPGKEPSAIVGLPKPVAFPKAATLLELPGWQILTDASKDELQRWLDARKQANHSVTWLDSVQVGDKPVFTAIAAMDGRAADWVAMLEVPALEVIDSVQLRKRIDIDNYVVLAMSGYAEGEIVRSALLWYPGRQRWSIGSNDTIAVNEKDLAEATKEGEAVRVLRPYPVLGKVCVASFLESTATDKTPWAMALAPEALSAYLEKQQQDGFRLHSLVPYLKDDRLRYCVVMRENKLKWQWETTLTITASELAAKATTYASKGFRAQAIAAFPYDGAVRYCVVWVKEPPKLVDYPKAPTLIEMPGWQILTEATKSEMQKWLDARKAAGHSVLWLDATQVGEKPVYSAAAALDGREAKWVAMLDVPSEDVADGARMSKRFEQSKHYLVSLSGYSTSESVFLALLWREGKRVSVIAPTNTPEFIEQQIEKIAKLGASPRAIRRIPLGADGALYGIYCEMAPAVKVAYALDRTETELAAFLERERGNGLRPLSLSAGVRNGQVVFAVVAVSNADKLDWNVDTGLTAKQLSEKAQELGKKGFTLSGATAYPWDGAVRYCAVWLQEPGKKP